MTEQEKQQLAENEQVKEVLTLLKENRTPGAEEFAQLISYVGQMENRLAEAVGELKNMRQELQEAQNHSLKAVMQKSCQAMEDSISDMRNRLSELKNKIIEGCQNILSDFKKRGVVALNGLTHFLGLRPLMEGLRETADKSIQTSNRAISRVESFSAEFHETGRHLKNMSRVLRGRDLSEAAKESGKIAGALKAAIRTERSCVSAIRNGAEKSLQSLEQLERSAQRPSVLKAMRYQKMRPGTEKVQAAPSREQESR